MIVVKGKITFNLFNKKFDLKDYDALNFFSDEKKYEIVCEWLNAFSRKYPFWAYKVYNYVTYFGTSKIPNLENDS